MQFLRNNLARPWVLSLVAMVGLAARMWLAAQGYNFDMDSWIVAANIMHHGGCVYVETDRYNYSPFWFCVIHGLDLLGGHHPAVLRYLTSGLLSLVDLGIFLVLLKRVGSLAATLFFLNPISIIISGYHCQFDNFAILAALGAAWLIGDDFDKLPILVIPPTLFVLSFVPYWSTAGGSIIQHVYCYQPAEMNHFYKVFVPAGLQHLCDSQTLWLAALLVFAFVCRTRTVLESALIYLGLLLALAPNTYNQYLAIPMVLAAVYPSVFFAVYLVAGTVHLCASNDGLHWLSQPKGGCVWLVADALCCALIWHLWRPQIRRGLEAMVKEFQIQFGWPK
jgi:hypothetical protein